jgi:hypothetical protein
MSTPATAARAQMELAERMISQQTSLMVATMTRIEELVNQNLATLTARVGQLTSRVDELRKRERSPTC